MENIKNITQNKNYGSIQDAITVAKDNDTIEIPLDTYTENLEITKSLKLIGKTKDSQKPIITSSDEKPFSISISDHAENVVLENLEIKPKSSETSGIRIYDEIKKNINVIIKNIVIENSSIGIGILNNSGNITIEKTYIKNLERMAIAVSKSENSKICVKDNCNFENCKGGFFLCDKDYSNFNPKKLKAEILENVHN